jgi:hypothetical protein
VSVTYWIGFYVSVISFISCIIVAYIDLSIENPKDFTFIKNNSANVTLNPIEAIKNFRTEFWLLCIIFSLGMSSVFPYINFSSEFLYKTKFAKITDKHLAETESDLFTGGCFIICAIIDPLMGIIQKKVGLRPYLLLLSVIFGFVAISLFFVSPTIGIINLGLSNSILLTVFWSTIGLVVKKSDEVNYISKLIKYLGCIILCC